MEGKGEGGLKGQAGIAKKDHSDEMEALKGEFVNNFVANCSLSGRMNGAKFQRIVAVVRINRVAALKGLGHAILGNFVSFC